mgnify:CR=1 FL=1
MDDKVKLPDTNIDESLPSYYSDIYSPWETKEQLEIGKEVKGSTWSGNIAIWYGSRASGSGTWTQAITGVWFTPKLILIQAVYAANEGATSEWQATSITNEYCNYTYNTSGGYYQWASYDASKIIFIQNYTGSVSRAWISSFDSDGFTLDWTTMWPTVNFKYQCFA